MLASRVNQRLTNPDEIARLLEENNSLLRSIDEKLRKIVFNTNGN
jgi:sensor histidine kinase regulating citrate/malate metabolism